MLLILVNEWFGPGKDAVQKFQTQNELQSFASRGDDLNAALQKLIEYQEALCASSHPATVWSYTLLSVSKIDGVDERLLARLRVPVIEDLPLNNEVSPGTLM